MRLKTLGSKPWQSAYEVCGGSILSDLLKKLEHQGYTGQTHAHDLWAVHILLFAGSVVGIWEKVSLCVPHGTFFDFAIHTNTPKKRTSVLRTTPLAGFLVAITYNVHDMVILDDIK